MFDGGIVGTGMKDDEDEISAMCVKGENRNGSTELILLEVLLHTTVGLQGRGVEPRVLGRGL